VEVEPVSERSKGELVSVITPVYNGAAYLGECIESVLGQTHTNFEYIIADNCSTDSSLSIARSYADSDARIRVVEAEEHVGPIQNWNRSLNAISPQSQYVKFVHADDWIFSDCIEKMLAVARCDESIGIVSAYRLEEDRVSLDRLPTQTPNVPGARHFTMDGRDVGRAVFLEFASVLGSPTSILLSKRALDETQAFFDESLLHADKEACFRILKDWRFGFVREVLTYTRRHNESVTSLTNVLDTRRQDDLMLLQRHGRSFLSTEEFGVTLRKTIDLYYGFLARSVGQGKGEKFWQSHRDVFDRADVPYERLRIVKALLRQWLDPRTAAKRLMKRSSDDAASGSVSDADKFLSSSRQKRGGTID
jgi:glycosyltransferase involved in cell wall biosynthesis